MYENGEVVLVTHQYFMSMSNSFCDSL